MKHTSPLSTLLLGAAMLASVLPVHGQDPGHGMDHNHGVATTMARAGQAELASHAAFDAQGRLWVTHKQDGKIVVRRSADFGRTWSPAIAVAAEPTDTGADARPKIALGRDGEVYLTWTRPMSQPYTGEIRFARSLDGGATFQPPVTVHRDRQEITHRFDAIAVDGAGRVFVAWIDKRSLLAAQAEKKTYRGAALFFAVSDDRGATFRGDFKAADHSCECCRIALLTRHDGSVSALWRHIFEPNIRDHALARLNPDGTATPVQRASFDDWRIDGCPHQGPALAEDGTGRFHAVWFSNSPSAAGLFYGRPARSETEGLRRLGSGSAERGDVAAAGNRIAIVWKQSDGERTDLRGSLSTDGGRTWREHRLASTAGAADHPRVLFHHDRFHVAWNTQAESLTVTPFPVP